MVTNLALRVGACEALANDIRGRSAAAGDSDTFQLADLLLDHLARITRMDGDNIIKFQARPRLPQRRQ